jgi:tetratricopeptide (TPR) repeat protein
VGARPAALLAVALGLCAPTPARAQGQEGVDWVGRLVMPKSPALVLRDGPRNIAMAGRCPYWVKQAVGRQLLLEPDGAGAGGWVSAAQVVPVEQAVDYFTGRIRNDPRDAYAYIMRAICWLRSQDGDRMLADLQQAVALEGESAEFYLLRGQARLLRGEYDAAIADCNRAIRLDPKQVPVGISIRGSARSRKKDHEGAIADLSRSIQLRPDIVAGYTNRGCAWIEAGDYDRAILDDTTALRLRPQLAQAYTDRGLAWHRKRKYDSAIADYDRAIRLEPKNAVTYGRRGCAWLNQGNLDAALVDCETAIRLDPACAMAYLCRGVSRRSRGKPDEALADLDRAIRRDPTLSEA